MKSFLYKIRCKFIYRKFQKFKQDMQKKYEMDI